jgi:hypothetical protein
VQATLVTAAALVPPALNHAFFALVDLVDVRVWPLSNLAGAAIVAGAGCAPWRLA